VQVRLALAAGEGKRAELNGARLRVAEQLRGELATLVFTPDRLAIVKGGPAARRAYVDRSLGRLFPSKSGLPAQYLSALAQRNAALKRGERDAIRPWTEQVAVFGSALVDTRVGTLALLAGPFGAIGDGLGLYGGRLAYEGEQPSAQLLEARLERDLERGSTGLGPHLDDISIVAGDRDLRAFGSQGEQRTAVLALLLAEAELLESRRGEPPLLLLDDVLSELDPDRRRALAGRVRDRGQTLITATTADALPEEPAQLLRVAPGEVRWSD
jgi:DNA replication and repair protein RecF